MPDLSHERRLGGVVAGVDEVGRGPLAGPVIAAAVIIDPATLPLMLADQLDDSKKLSKKKRVALADLVLQSCCFGFGEASVDEIDRLNILQATFLAMRRAVAALGRPVDCALVDGNQIPALGCGRVECLVGGDGLSLSIAAASVIAKVRRDGIMAELAAAHPGYGWESNSGYGTAIHMQALRQLGPTPHHRRSFAPVAQLSLL